MVETLPALWGRTSNPGLSRQPDLWPWSPHQTLVPISFTITHGLLSGSLSSFSCSRSIQADKRGSLVGALWYSKVKGLRTVRVMNSVGFEVRGWEDLHVMCLGVTTPSG